LKWLATSAAHDVLPQKKIGSSTVALDDLLSHVLGEPPELILRRPEISAYRQQQRQK
jgi:hypothetical protein